ncbi:MAG: carbohydrate binding domain-containing protein [Chloroflexota bacterium]
MLCALSSWNDGPGYGGLSRAFADVQDWRDYTHLRLWVKGSNTGDVHRIELKSDGDSASASNRYVYAFTDTSAAWRLLDIPFDAFVSRMDFSPGPNPSDALNLAAIWGYSLLLAPGSGTIAIDDVAAIGKTLVHDFDRGQPDGVGPFFDAESAETFSFDIETLTNTNIISTESPMKGSKSITKTNGAISVTYEIMPRGFGGVTANFSDAQDWQRQDGLQFWFKGSSTNRPIRIELLSGGKAAQASNRYEYLFMDTSDQWQLFTLPFSQFSQRMDFNPGPNPDSPINLARMWGYSVLLPAGIGSMVLDDVTVYDQGDIAPIADVTEANYVVQEGDALTVTVALKREDLSTDEDDVVTIDYVIDGGISKNSATAVDDYFPSTGTLTFALSDLMYRTEGIAEQFVVIQTVDDALVESHETIQIQLQNPNGATLGLQDMATITIRDNDTPPPAPSENLRTVLDTFTSEGSTDNPEPRLPSGWDPNGIGVGFNTWHDAESRVTIASEQLTVDSAIPPLPGARSTRNRAADTVIRVDGDVTSWGGFTHAFSNETADRWLSQDWSQHVGFGFWIYGGNTGNRLFIDILENRNPDATTEDAQRWTYEFGDDFSGWGYIEIPFSAFYYKDVGNGAPNDDLTLEEVHGWAFGMWPTNGSQTYYLADVGVVVGLPTEQNNSTVDELVVDNSSNRNIDQTQPDTIVAIVDQNVPTEPEIKLFLPLISRNAQPEPQRHTYIDDVLLAGDNLTELVVLEATTLAADGSPSTDDTPSVASKPAAKGETSSEVKLFLPVIRTQANINAATTDEITYTELDEVLAGGTLDSESVMELAMKLFLPLVRNDDQVDLSAYADAEAALDDAVSTKAGDSPSSESDSDMSESKVSSPTASEIEEQVQLYLSIIRNQENELDASTD